MPFAMYALTLVLFPFAAVLVWEPQRSAATSTRNATGGHTAARVAAVVVGIYAVSFLVQIAFYMVPVQLPFYLRELGVTEPFRAGIALSTMTICAAVVALRFRWIQSRLDRTVILSISLSLLCIGFLLVSRATTYAAVIASLIVIGLAMGLNFPNLMGWLMASTPAHVRGRIVGGLTTCVFLGQFFSPLASYPFVESGGLAYGYRVMGFLLAGLAIISMSAAALKPLQTRRQTGS